LGAFRAAFVRHGAVVGPQGEWVGGATAWLLPNPSGLNAHYQLPDLAALFGELRAASDGPVSEVSR
jgi:TDG/mug DNA glycosylase family protein